MLFRSITFGTYCQYGALGGVRTPGLRDVGAALSQLSYEDLVVLLPGIEPSPPVLQTGAQTTYASGAWWSHGRGSNSRDRALQART